MTVRNERIRDVTGFVRAEGRQLVNGEGREILLRGVGFGGWLLPEGYMWKFPKGGDRPRRMERMIEDLIGSDKAARFWELYYERYTAEADIERIAEEGFNSVRVPINARSLLEEGEPLQFKERHIAYIDRVIDWCRKHRLYVILDLHGASGGQTGANIDDSGRDHPDLFADERNKRNTVALWRMLAERYKEEWIVAGYDLLNEPLPDHFSAYNSHILPLYKEIVEAIREVDDRHLIILEGVHWATDWSVFTEKIDGNLMLQFHKYWSSPDTESLEAYLDKREEWNVPIYMGEGGENNKDWYVGAFQLFEDLNISWNFWTWKKMVTTNSPCSIRMPDDWGLLTGYLEGGGRPDAAAAECILWEFLDNLPLERCTYHEDVVRSLFRRAPFRIPAVYYGNKGEGVSFGLGVRRENQLGFRDRDGTDIRFTGNGQTKLNFQNRKRQEDEHLFVQLGAGDWLAYEFVVAGSGTGSDSGMYTIRLKLCPVHERADVRISVNGEDAGSVETAGDGEEWQEIDFAAMKFEPGPVRVVIRTGRYPVRIEYLEIV